MLLLLFDFRSYIGFSFYVYISWELLTTATTVKTTKTQPHKLISIEQFKELK